MLPVVHVSEASPPQCRSLPPTNDNGTGEGLIEKGMLCALRTRYNLHDTVAQNSHGIFKRYSIFASAQAALLHMHMPNGGASNATTITTNTIEITDDRTSTTELVCEHHVVHAIVYLRWWCCVLYAGANSLMVCTKDAAR